VLLAANDVLAAAVAAADTCGSTVAAPLDVAVAGPAAYAGCADADGLLVPLLLPLLLGLLLTPRLAVALCVDAVGGTVGGTASGDGGGGKVV
jgi:hypothetical protein